MKKLLFMVILIVLLASAPLVSCKGQPASTPSETAPTETPPTGQPTPPTGQPTPPTGQPTPPTGQPTPPTGQPTPPTGQPTPPTQPSATAEAERIEPEPTKGFYWAYYLYIPSTIRRADSGSQKTYLLVEGNHSEGTSDDQAVHDNNARKIAQKNQRP